MRHDSKVMLYVMLWLKAVLNSVDLQFHHYAVKKHDNLERLCQTKSHKQPGDS